VNGDDICAGLLEMVVNVRDSPVEQFMSRDVVLLPKLITIRPAAEQFPQSSSLPSSADAANMHHYNNKVVNHSLRYHFVIHILFRLNSVCQSCLQFLSGYLAGHRASSHCAVWPVTG